MKYISRLFYTIASVAAVMFAAASCSDELSEISEEIPLSRCLTPTDLVARVYDGQYVDFSWTKTRGSESFVLELFLKEINLKDETQNEVVRDLTVSAGDDFPVTLYLDPDKVYYARVKACAEGLKDSNWAVFPKKIETVAIKDGLNPEIVARGATSITIKWTVDPEVDHVRITPAIKADEEFTRFDIDEAGVKAGQVEVTGLLPSTYYTLTLHYSSADRGSVTAWTLPDASKATVAKDTAQIRQLIKDGAEIIAVPYADTAYVIGNVEVVKALTLMGQPGEDGSFPTIVGAFKLEAGTTLLSLQGLKLDGNNYKYGHVITVDTALEGLTVEAVNCELTAFTKGFYYDNYASKVPSLLIDGCIFTDFQPSGGDFVDVRQQVEYGSVKIVNSTFDTGARDFIRFDAKVVVNSFMLDHCTFSNWARTSTNNGIFYVRGTVADFQCTNNLFLNENGVEKNCLIRQATYKVPVFSNNYFYNCGGADDYFLKNAISLSPDSKLEEGILKNDPCQDSGLSQFNLVNEELAALGIGDPRWLEEYVKIPEDLTQDVTVPVKTWNLSDSKVFYKSASEDMVRDGIRFYVKDNPVVFEADGFLFTTAATLEAGVPVDCGIGIKVNAPGSLVLSTGTAGDGSGLAVVNRDGKPAIGVPAGAANTKVVFADITDETMIYVYGTGQIKVTGLQWSDDIDTGGSNVLADPAPVIDITSVNEGEDKTVTISWDTVDKAGAYGITVNGADKGSVADTKYEIATKDLAPGEYVVGVTALPAATDLVREASAEVAVQFTVKEILKQLKAETVWDAAYFESLSTKYGTDAVKDDFVEKNLGYVNGGGSGFKFAQSDTKSATKVYRAQLAGAGTFKDGVLSKCGMQIMVGGNGTLELHAASSGDAARVLIVNGEEKNVTAAKVDGNAQDPTVITMAVTANAGDLVGWCSKSGGINIFYVKWTPSADAPAPTWPTDETAINETWMSDYTKTEKYPAQEYDANVTIEKVTYYASSDKKIKWASNRLQFGGKPSLDNTTYPGVSIPTGARYATFKITRPGKVSVFFYAGGSNNTGRNGSVVLETNVGGTKAAKVLHSADAALSTSASDGLIELSVTAEDLAGITEAAVLYFFSNNNTIQITKIGFDPAS